MSTDLIAIARECGADFDDACSDGSRVVVLLLSEQLAAFAARIKAEQWQPDGYQLVPIEPTPEMIAAGDECHATWPYSERWPGASSKYRAMLAAAIRAGHESTT